MTTDQDIKEKLFQLWDEKVPQGPGSRHYRSFLYNYQTIREIKALMIKDGVPTSEINKIIKGE